LISIIYPLYGTILDDFTIVTITNTNDLPVKLMISSEVQGFTTQSVDTVTVEPQSNLEAAMIGNGSFSDAVDMAGEEYAEVSEMIENGEPSYNWLTIATAREKGIFPLPWP
jgi:hypothetical protein